MKVESSHNITIRNSNEKKRQSVVNMEYQIFGLYEKPNISIVVKQKYINNDIISKGCKTWKVPKGEKETDEYIWEYTFENGKLSFSFRFHHNIQRAMVGKQFEGFCKVLVEVKSMQLEDSSVLLLTTKNDVVVQTNEEPPKFKSWKNPENDEVYTIGDPLRIFQAFGISGYFHVGIFSGVHEGQAMVIHVIPHKGCIRVTQTTIEDFVGSKLKDVHIYRITAYMDAIYTRYQALDRAIKMCKEGQIWE